RSRLEPATREPEEPRAQRSGVDLVERELLLLEEATQAREILGVRRHGRLREALLDLEVREVRVDEEVPLGHLPVLSTARRAPKRTAPVPAPTTAAKRRRWPRGGRGRAKPDRATGRAQRAGGAG